jgi:hypothetical protein
MDIVPTIRLRTFDANDVPNVYGMKTFNDVTRELHDYNTANNNKLLVPWHKGSHLVANDKHRGGAWKKDCPTVEALINDMCNAFNVTAVSTRVNVYSLDGRHHVPDIKPFHHDRSASTPGLSQNLTISLSLGATREIGFKYVKYKAEPDRRWMFVTPKRYVVPPVVISNVCESGSIYAFARDVNCEWQHGVLASNDSIYLNNRDRVSIIVWGTRNDMDMTQSRISKRMIPSPFELGISFKNVVQAKLYLNT